MVRVLLCNCCSSILTRIVGNSFVCAMAAANMDAGVPHLIRTYQAPTNVLPDCTIIRAVRATTAAPTFFKPAYLDESETVAYIDGGMGCNNPVDWVLIEAENLYPGRKLASIVSIGTGHSGTISIPKAGVFQRILPLDVVNAIQRIATDCERKANEVERRFVNISDVYFRFSVDQGLQGVGLGDWERSTDIEGATQQYIRLERVHKPLGRAVAAIRERKGIIPVNQISMARIYC